MANEMQVDLVTETDKACEDLVFNHLKKRYPDHQVKSHIGALICCILLWIAVNISLFLLQFIGEETSAAFGTAELTDDPTWIVDPLDGTTNFVHGYL